MSFDILNITKIIYFKHSFLIFLYCGKQVLSPYVENLHSHEKSNRHKRLIEDLVNIQDQVKQKHYLVLQKPIQTQTCIDDILFSKIDVNWKVFLTYFRK